jgi:hypothetical protein
MVSGLIAGMRAYQSIDTRRGIMFEVKDYSEERVDNHYNGVPSMYGKIVNEQQKMQPKYCEPGEVGGEMEGEHSNVQEGP